MSLHYAILGFLSHRPLSGYDLKKAFDGSVRHFWPADQSQIYRTLSQLEDRQLVDKAVIEQEERPDRKVYSITAEGQQELVEWLRSPLPMQDERDPFLVQVFFAGLLSNEELLEVLAHQKAEIEGKYELLRHIYQTSSEQIQEQQAGRASLITLLTAEHALVIGQAYLEWLDDLMARVENDDFTPKTF
ncbi:MAG: PadR family transcriptional regulator [Chloroflexi bacterium]|nr:MAG: PadR family transcriptional regulator [Chloroflexota bacterium]MBL1196333.1 PadR family transcriptional regulator [Chloroflexota bacterium]NOH13628.1 PadR family transcriptional regulator [Chloroflexota bacterium]